MPTMDTHIIIHVHVHVLYAETILAYIPLGHCLKCHVEYLLYPIESFGDLITINNLILCQCCIYM